MVGNRWILKRNLMDFLGKLESFVVLLFIQFQVLLMAISNYPLTNHVRLFFPSRFTPVETSRISSSPRTTRKLEVGAARTPLTRTSARGRHVGSNHSVV